MTSNIASPLIQDLGAEAAMPSVLAELRRHFRPEFLNRVDEIVVFRPLGRDQLGRIVEIQLGRLRKLLAERQITVSLTDAAREAIADAGYDPVYGARPLKRALQRMVQDPLALRLLRGEFRPGDHVVVDEGPDGAITFAKGPRPAESEAIH